MHNRLKIVAQHSQLWYCNYSLIVAVFYVFSVFSNEAIAEVAIDKFERKSAKALTNLWQ